MLAFGGTVNNDLIRAAIGGLRTGVSRNSTKIRSLESTVKALKARAQRVDLEISGLIVGNTDIPITWPQVWPDTDYVVLHAVVSGGVPLGNVHVTIKAATKTTTGVTITVSNTTLITIATVGVQVVGLRL